MCTMCFRELRKGAIAVAKLATARRQALQPPFFMKKDLVATTLPAHRRAVRLGDACELRARAQPVHAPGVLVPRCLPSLRTQSACQHGAISSATCGAEQVPCRRRRQS